MTMVAVNQAAFWPTVAAIKDKSYELCRGKGGGGGGHSDDEDEPMEGDDAMWNLLTHPQWQRQYS
jgi:hypothetical protein